MVVESQRPDEVARNLRRLVVDHEELKGLLHVIDVEQAFEKAGDQAFPGQGNRPPLEEEIRRLQAENKRLQMERDILKKATAFFAREAL